MAKKLFGGIFFSLIVLLALVAAMNWLAPMATAQLLRSVSRASAGLEAKSLAIQGKTFPYLMGGSGEPLVLVHGFTANKDIWDAAARHLTPRYTVYAPDLPGFGDASRDPNADYSYDAQVENLHAFLQGLGLKRFHLGGSSMGGGVAALYAAKYPQEVASLWLLDAAATRELADSELMKRYDATGEFPLLVKTQEQQVKKLDLVFGQPKFVPYAVVYALTEAARRDYDLHSKILKTLRRSAPIESRYANLQTPTLIVTGALDRIVPPAAVRTLAKVFPRNEIKVMPGLGHTPMVEAPGMTDDDYLAFRRALPKTP